MFFEGAQMNRLKQLSLFVCAAICMITQANGQLTTATLTGTITDGSGAAVPGASLKLDNITRGTSRTAVADGGGRFSFDFVPVRAYRLTVSQTGFETGTRSGLELSSGQVLDLPIQLAIQQQTQTIEVQANAAQLDTTEAQQVATLNEAYVHELPVAHLDWSNLLADTAGTQKPAFQSSLNSTLPYGSGETVNGLPSAGYNFMVDGTNAGNNVRNQGRSAASANVVTPVVPSGSSATFPKVGFTLLPRADLGSNGRVRVFRAVNVTAD
jgi:hypothetical protein